MEEYTQTLDYKKLKEDTSKIFSEIMNYDQITAIHSLNVGMNCAAWAKEQGFTEEKINEYYYGGLLHDIGKLNISPDIINKPDRLTDLEFETIKTHPIKGLVKLKEMSEELSKSDVVRNMIVYHHEAYKGYNGYPKIVDGEEIPLEARVCAVADVYDALSAKRSYKEALPLAKVYEIMEESTKLDQSLVQEFEHIINKSITKDARGSDLGEINKIADEKAFEVELGKYQRQKPTTIVGGSIDKKIRSELVR